MHVVAASVAPGGGRVVEALARALKVRRRPWLCVYRDMRQLCGSDDVEKVLARMRAEGVEVLGPGSRHAAGWELARDGMERSSSADASSGPTAAAPRPGNGDVAMSTACRDLA